MYIIQIYIYIYVNIYKGTGVTLQVARLNSKNAEQS